jgi:hypothetical protein
MLVELASLEFQGEGTELLFSREDLITVKKANVGQMSFGHLAYRQLL